MNAPTSEMWIMASKHPFYPSITFFSTEAEAREAAKQEIEYMEAKDGYYEDSSVSVALVKHHASIRTEH